MKFGLLHVYTLLSLALVASHAVTPDVYWKFVLPNSPMPKAIKDIPVSTAGWTEEKYFMAGVGDDRVQVGPFVYKYAASSDQLKDEPNVALFFLEKDLHQGNEMKLHFMKRDQSQKTTFLPRQVADSIPFSSNKLPQIYNKFSIKPHSLEAEIMKQTLSECEDIGIEGEEKYWD